MDDVHDVLTIRTSAHFKYVLILVVMDDVHDE